MWCRSRRITAFVLALTLLMGDVSLSYAAQEMGVSNGQTEAEEQGKSDLREVTISGEYKAFSKEKLINESSRERKVASKAMASGAEGSGTVASGGMETGTAYQIAPTLLEYDSVYTLTRQYACPERNGVYFLQGANLSFLDLGTGAYSTVYTFESSSGSVFYTGGMLYWGDGNTVIKYDLAGQQVQETLKIEALSDMSGIGVDASGRIYTYGSYEGIEDRVLLLFTPSGELLDSREMQDPVYDFCGFSSDGTFYYIGYYNYIYWGYEHDMDALFAGRVQGDVFSDEKLILLENVGQQYFSEHQDYAALLSDTMLADHFGNVFDVSRIHDLAMSTVLSVERGTDEELAEYSDLSSIGTRMLYDVQSDTILAYTSGKKIFRYDLATKEQTQKYVAQHYVFNLLDYGDKIIAIEREAGNFYVEVIDKGSFSPIVPQEVNLNETETYQSHTRENVEAQYEASKIEPNLQVYESEYSLSPYKEAVLTEEMKSAVLDYSNFLRWLGGLTPFESASGEMWTKSGRGALLLTRLNELTHDPSKPDDMDEAFYADAHDACSGSNLYGGGVREGDSEAFMSFINGWLDDTANVSNLELGHRFEFLQREGYQISYGATDRYLSQKVELYGGQLNTTGTVTGVDNNDYCYTWPSAGYFPADVIDTKALWSFNLNADKISLSNKAMKVTVTDLETGEVTDVSSSLGSSAYYGVNDYFGYFKGMHFYFNPPETDSYRGKSYQVTVSNLELPDGEPAYLSYRVDFFTPFMRGDADESGDVGIEDLRLVLRHVCKKITLESTAYKAADVTDDGNVGIEDLRKILRFVCGKITEL